MIVYRDQRRRADTGPLLTRLRRALDRLDGAHPPPHDEVVSCLIDLGILEAGLVDALCPELDAPTPVADCLRQASHAAGHLLWHSWHGTWPEAPPWLARLRDTLDALACAPLPSPLDLAVPEGYAHYALYPEAYLEAVRRGADLLGRRVLCIGIRSIGTSLSGVAAAACEELGHEVLSLTLRPRGHPFDRRPVVAPDLSDLLRSWRGATVLLIDEGPGLSGSSLAGTAALLSELGFPDDRILFLPSWRADGRGLRSADARARWSRHRQLVATFEEVWLLSGRLAGALLGSPLRDVSGGAWRQELYPDPGQYPPVQPQHERRKYLAEHDACACATPSPKLLVFTGLGRCAEGKLERARRLAAAGFAPVPQRVVHGFLVREFVEGTPVERECRDPELLDAMARYLAQLGRDFPAEPTVTVQALAEMCTNNVVEGLGEQWGERLQQRLRGGTADRLERSVALDGRMFPHEWLRTRRGYLKADGLDHHADHFFPGCQDIAWDVAGTCLEFGLEAAERRRLVERYRTLSGDRTIAARLPFHAVAYLAFRVGYASLAASVLGDTPDGRRFARAAAEYAGRLREELQEGPHGRWDA